MSVPQSPQSGASSSSGSLRSSTPTLAQRLAMTTTALQERLLQPVSFPGIEGGVGSVGLLGSPTTTSLGHLGGVGQFVSGSATALPPSPTVQTSQVSPIKSALAGIPLHLTTAAATTSQIQQLLTTMAKPSIVSVTTGLSTSQSPVAMSPSATIASLANLVKEKSELQQHQQLASPGVQQTTLQAKTAAAADILNTDLQLVASPHVVSGQKQLTSFSPLQRQLLEKAQSDRMEPPYLPTKLPPPTAVIQAKDLAPSMPLRTEEFATSTLKATTSGLTVPVVESITAVRSASQPHSLSPTKPLTQTLPPIIELDPAGDTEKQDTSVADILVQTSQGNADQVQAIQKLQFHDFPLTTTVVSKHTGTPKITHAKILTDKQVDLSKLQSLQEGGIRVSVTAAGSGVRGNQASSASSVTPSTVVTFTSVSSKPNPVSMATTVHQPTLSISSFTAPKESASPTTTASTTINFAISSGKPQSQTITATETTTSGSSLVASGAGMTLAHSSPTPVTETLGKVQSIIEDSPKLSGTTHLTKTIYIGNAIPISSTSQPATTAKSDSLLSGSKPSAQQAPTTTSGTKVTVVTTSGGRHGAGGSSGGRGGHRAPPSVPASYSTTAKQVLPPTIASTRTRRIKTPKQYDL